jgi:nucleotide-binding universal stress UspA family protein
VPLNASWRLFELDEGEGPAMFRRILIPVDIAEPEIARETVRQASDLARLWDGELRLVCIQFPDLVSFSDYGLVDPGDRLRHAAEDQLLELARASQYTQKRVSTAVRFGAILPEILAEADEWPADLIALGSHAPNIATYVLGSNAAHIVRHAKCSVLVIR